MSIGRKIGIVIKGLIVSYAVTGVLLLALAYAVYRFRLEETISSLIIIAIYVIVTFVGAFVVGKQVKEKRFLWGLILGLMYILIITVAGLLISKAFHVTDTANLTTAMLCVGGGLLGGMLS
jgi:putative membrane protein (TIGR04086 family)